MHVCTCMWCLTLGHEAPMQRSGQSGHRLIEQTQGPQHLYGNVVKCAGTACEPRVGLQDPGNLEDPPGWRGVGPAFRILDTCPTASRGRLTQEYSPDIIRHDMTLLDSVV